MAFWNRSIISWFIRPVHQAGPGYTQVKPVVENLEDRLVPATLPSLEQLMAQSGTLTILSPDVAAQVPIEEYADSQVLTLDASHDVVDQISNYLARQSSASIGVVRIIGHGSDGTLLLGDQLFNQQTLSRREGQISGWKRAFTPGADMLVYGCSVASTTDGRTFVDTLGRLTGTDVAASTNLTGSTTLGGDLALEYATGQIQATTGRFAQAWAASGLTLAAPVFTSANRASFSTGVAGSFTANRNGTIYTYYHLQVTENLKSSTPSTVDVAVPGGSVGRVMQSVAGAPELKQGGEYVLFLWTSRSGLTQIIGLSQGAFDVRANAAGVVVSRPAASDQMLDARGHVVVDSGVTLNLSDLRARIDALVGGVR